MSIMSILFLVVGVMSAKTKYALPYEAVIVDPVVDMHNSFPAPYKPAACCDVTSNCHRAHQALFNELVTVIKIHKDQAQVSCERAIYGVEGSTVRNTFWVRKKHLFARGDLKMGVSAAIPNLAYGFEPTVVLTLPWQNFSLGTRFRALSTRAPDAYVVLIPDYKKQRVIKKSIPMTHAMLEQQKEPALARKLLVNVVNNLVDYIGEQGDEAIVPYVWGGSSCMGVYQRSDLYHQDHAWHASYGNNPYGGYDCSGLIMRMARIAGIDFSWKTSACIQSFCKDLAAGDILEAGDILWTPGHVMLVSNVQKNELIEARGYKSGFGCVQRTTVARCFAGVSGYEGLVDIYRTGRGVRYLNSAGEPWGEVLKFKILKLIR